MKNSNLIHRSSLVSPEAKLAEDVRVGPFTVVHGNVVIGAGTHIDGFCEIGYPTELSDGQPLIIGANSKIRSHSVFYEGSTFGANLVTGHRVCVREKTVAGENLQIGTLSDIQGDCVIGDFVRFHSNVHIGKRSRVGNFVWIFPYVVLTNDPHPPSNVLKGVTVEDFAVIATMAVVLPGVRIGENSLVGAHSLVSRDVEPNTVVSGVPAKVVCPTSKILLQDGSGQPAYPWKRHFHRGYPDHIISLWKRSTKPDGSP